MSQAPASPTVDGPAPAPRWPFLALVAAGVGTALGIFLVVTYLRVDLGFAELGDLQVYRGAVESMLQGGDLYSFQIEVHGFTLPFTYPPFAALVMVPLAVAPASVAGVVSVLLNCAAAVLLVVLITVPTPLGKWGWRPERVLAVGLGVAALVWSDPVMHGTSLGQVSGLLVLLVVADFVVVPPRWRGALTGIAAAIKLTPAIFIAYLLVTRQWRQAINATAVAAACTLIGFAVLPRESLQYWSSLLWQTGRVGDVEAVRNKSLLGGLYHLGVDPAWIRPVWLVAVLAVVVVGMWQAWRRHRQGEEIAAVLIVGVLSTVISPISWTHHLVWIPLAGLYLVYRGRRWSRVIGLGMVAAAATLSPLMSYGGPEKLWPDFLGDGITVIAVLITVLGLPRGERQSVDVES